MKQLTLFICIASIASTLFAQNPATDGNAAPHSGSDAYNSNSLCGVDQFGRTFNTITGNRTGKYVGMFYFLWLGQHQDIMTGIYDNTKILAADSGSPYKNLFNLSGTAISPINRFHFWGEPLYNYYTSSDDYVLRKHVELLTAAGIDFLVFDATNASTYDSVWIKLFRILDACQKLGWNVPKVAFYTNSYSETTMIHLYNVLYSKNLYPDLWFRPDGVKPLIIGKFDNEPTSGMESTLRNFFYFRLSQWPDERAHCSDCPDSTVFHPDGFPWTDWQKPQRLYGGGNNMSIMNVSLAQHPQLPFSDSYLIGSLNWGRGFSIVSRISDTTASTGNTNYRYVPGKNDSTKVETGANFQQEWKLALKTDPQMVFVTGWNEWISVKQAILQGTPNERIAFVDNFNKEYSRDIEPMAGGYNDAFYIQLIQNVRKYKGISGAPIQTVSRTIDIKGDIAQWNDVSAKYRNIGGESFGRNSSSFSLQGPRYVMAAPANNLQEIRVTHDGENLYFYIRSGNPVSAYSPGQTNWMNLFIGTDQVARKGWEGYSYVVNRTPDTSGKTSVEKLDSTGAGVKIADADYSVNNNIMQIMIKKSSIGISDSSFQIYFKVADGVEKQFDIMDYYVTGRSLPMGRLSFSYNAIQPTSVKQTNKQLPTRFAMSQNYPNPFNPATEIKYSIPQQAMVNLRVFNLLGQELVSLVNQEQKAGEYKADFNASHLASGIYICRLQAGANSVSMKMTLLK